MGKKRKHEQNGMTSAPIDEMPRSSDTFPSSICDVLIQFKDTIQIKVKTDELLQKLEKKVGLLEKKVEMLEEKVKNNESKHKRRIRKFKESVKRKINEFKEGLKLELQKKIQILEEDVKNKSKQNWSVFTEDFKKELEVKEEPKLEIQEEMQKEVCAKEHHHNGSPSLRSQLHQRETTNFHLEFMCDMDTVVYKGKPIRTIEVILFDGGNQIAPDHHLASVAVELVVIDGEFSGQGYWSEDEFQQNIVKLRQGNNSMVDRPKFQVKKGRFQLVGGRSLREDVVIMENSNRKDVKLGVMVVGDKKERVREGVSKSFRVQEAKTEKGQDKKNVPPKTGPVNLHNMMSRSGMAYHNTSGNGLVAPFPIGPLQYPTQQGITIMESCGNNCGIMPNQMQKTQAQTSGNGPGGEPPIDHLQKQNTTQQGITQQGDHGQVKKYISPQRGPSNFHRLPNPSGVTYHTTGTLPLDPLQYPTQQDITGVGSYGNGPGRQPLVEHLQQQNTTQPRATQQEDHAGQGQQYMQRRTGPNSFHNMLNPPGIPYHPSAGSLPLAPLQYPTQQMTRVGCHGTENDSGIVPNQLQNIHAHPAGNGPGSQALVDHLQQQNSTQQGFTQLENHGSDVAPKNGVDESSTDIIRMSPFVDNAFEDDARFIEAMRRYAAGSGRSADRPVAPEDAYQDGGAIDRSAPAAESTQMNFTQSLTASRPVFEGALAGAEPENFADGFTRDLVIN